MIENLISAAAMIVVTIIEVIAATERKKVKEERRRAEHFAATEKEKAASRERAREELLVLLVRSTRASISLGEATAHALQRGHTNGDTEAALEYAQKIKQAQKDFLAEQGIHAMWE